MKTIQDFENFYHTDLRPVLEDFENRRGKICGKLTGIGIGLLVLLGTALAAIPPLRADLTNMIFPVIMAGLLGGAAWWFFTKDFIREFKLLIIREVVAFVDPSLSYAPQAHISRGEFEASRIFKHRIDRFRGEDLVSGTIGKTDMRFSELHAEYKTTTTDSKGRRRTQWHTIFKGLFFVADFNKHFTGCTVVLPDTAERLFGFLGKKLQQLNLARGKLIKLEDPEFEKAFAVYGDDQVEARYILSTSLMKRIMDFKQSTGKPIYLSFVHSNVIVAITTGKDMFEPRIFRSLLDFGLVREYLEDLQLAIGIVEDLNLNTRIWTKE
jgi:hypothetical protein